MDSPMHADLDSYREGHTIHRAFPQEERGQSLPHSPDNKAGVGEPQVVSWVLPTLLQGTQQTVETEVQLSRRALA